MRPVINAIKAELGDAVYSEDDETLQQVCVRELLRRGETVSTAESCTGGQVAAAIVDIDGCSASFPGGCVTYSNQEKAQRIGVPEEILNTVGPVSFACAKAMAEGIRRTIGTDYGVATTGIAGPGGGTEQTPVGTVFVAVASKEKTFVKELRLGGNRDRVRRAATLHALDLLRRVLFGLPTGC